MKKAAPLLLLLAASLASAGTYTVTTSTREDNRIERDRLRINKATCALVQLPADCTQAQARAKEPTLNVYADAADYVQRYVLNRFLQTLKAIDTSDDAQQFCAWFKAATTTQQNAACILAGLPNGCEICP